MPLAASARESRRRCRGPSRGMLLCCPVMSPAVSREERPWLLTTIAALLLLSTIPLAVAAAVTPPGLVFSGFVTEARDGVSYVAKTMQGLQGRWLYHDPYTSEAQPQTLVYLP